MSRRKLFVDQLDDREPPSYPKEEAIGCPAPAKPILTDWISCVTPPVRVGFYERDWGCPDMTQLQNMDYWDGSRWFYGDGKGGYGTIEPISPYLRWRGIRKWVLQSPATVGGGVLYLLPETTFNHDYWHEDITRAIGFETRAAALKFAAAIQTLNFTAVLP